MGCSHSVPGYDVTTRVIEWREDFAVKQSKQKKLDKGPPRPLKDLCDCKSQYAGILKRLTMFARE